MEEVSRKNFLVVERQRDYYVAQEEIDRIQNLIMLAVNTQDLQVLPGYVSQIEELKAKNGKITGSVEPVQRIKDVPDNIPVKDLKELLDQLGYSHFHWGLHTIMPEDEWIEDYWGDEFFTLQDALSGMPDLDYEELIDRRNGEKRITLRLPYTLHYALSQKAGRVTLNSYCIKVLAEAVNYGEKLEEYESSRRKPGRPKKVQDAE